MYLSRLLDAGCYVPHPHYGANVGPVAEVAADSRETNGRSHDSTSRLQNVQETEALSNSWQGILVVPAV